MWITWVENISQSTKVILKIIALVHLNLAVASASCVFVPSAAIITRVTCSFIFVLLSYCSVNEISKNTVFGRLGVFFNHKIPSNIKAIPAIIRCTEHLQSIGLQVKRFCGINGSGNGN
ncbi:hypothetical protein SUGI_0313210 [Cryptomeria japonica]|nr:hypothetical protein SUGI_0313210 [Cryptomeria japonica]